MVPTSRTYLFYQPIVVMQLLSRDALTGWLALVQEAVTTQQLWNQREIERSSSLLRRWLSQGLGRVRVNNTTPTKFRSRGRVRGAIPTQTLPALQNVHNISPWVRLPIVHSKSKRKPGQKCTVVHQTTPLTPEAPCPRQRDNKVTSKQPSVSSRSKGTKAANQRTLSQMGFVASERLYITRAQADKESRKVDFSGSLLSTAP